MNVRAIPSGDLDRASFEAIAALAYRECGLTLTREKTPMVRSRLRHRLRALELPDFASYADLLLSEAGTAERAHLISALTTNVSHFFREAHHFETLRDTFRARLPRLRAGGAMRIWSAGCSNGQEPLSAAMTLLAETPDIAELDVRILATDIDPSVIAFARRGVYPDRLLGGVSADLMARFFGDAPPAGHEGCKAVAPEVAALIRFNILNLLGDWPMRRRFDVIFCRNVVIYFDPPTQRALWPRLHAALASDGVLFLGHSERIPDPQTHGFDCTGPTTYRPLPA